MLTKFLTVCFSGLTNPGYQYNESRHQNYQVNVVTLGEQEYGLLSQMGMYLQFLAVI